MTRSILIVCDRNGRTSIGHLPLSAREALLASGWDAETLWLRVPRYFPAPEALPGPSLEASSLPTGLLSFRAGFRRILEERLGSIVYHPDMQITHQWARENTRTFRGRMRQIRSVFKYFLKWGVTW